MRTKEPATNEPAAPAPSGITSIRVVWGEETIHPIQYNGYRVGPLEVTVEVKPGEDPDAVYEKTWAWLDKLGRDQNRRKVEGFLARLAEASKVTKQNMTPRGG